MSGRIRVLVVEDSGFMRRAIRQLLASDPELEVVGDAVDGHGAVQAVHEARPDVVTMDVNMPRADGLFAVERIMAERPTPIVMLSSYTRAGSEAALRALELGAIDCVAKPSGSVDLELTQVRDELLRKLKVAARVRVVRTVSLQSARVNDERACAALPRRQPVPEAGAPARRTATLQAPPLCVLIAASTGGPAVLLEVLPRLSALLPAAIVVIQHMPAPYTAQLASMLDARTVQPVSEARDEQRLQAGTILIAPGARDCIVCADGTIRLQAPVDGAAGCPSADLAMTSAAHACAGRVLGVVLTGMGRDGAEGARAIRAAGGLVIVQDEPSSLVYGMPRAALETGCVRTVVARDELPAAIAQCLGLLTMMPASVAHAP